MQLQFAISDNETVIGLLEVAGNHFCLHLVNARVTKTNVRLTISAWHVQVNVTPYEYSDDA